MEKCENGTGFYMEKCENRVKNAWNFVKLLCNCQNYINFVMC